MNVYFDEIVTEHDPTELFEQGEKKRQKAISFLERWFGPKTIKGGIEFYDKSIGHANPAVRRKDPKGPKVFDDKFMEPVSQFHLSMATTTKDDKVGASPDSNQISEVKVELREAVKLSELMTIKPQEVPPPPEPLCMDILESDRSEKWLKSSVDFSKLKPVDPSVASELLKESQLREASAKKYRFTPY